MTATPPRKTNPLLRVMISAVLVAFAVFVVQYKRSATPARPSAPAPAKPFLTEAPSSEGSNRFAWVPPYPGATIENINTKQTRDQLSYGFSFRAPEDFKHVLAFYRDRLQAAGFKVDVKGFGRYRRETCMPWPMGAAGRSTRSPPRCCKARAPKSA